MQYKWLENHIQSTYLIYNIASVDTINSYAEENKSPFYWSAKTV